MKTFIKKVLNCFKKDDIKDHQENQITWKGDLISVKEIKRFLYDIGYNYQILEGDTRWDEKKRKKVLYTEPFLLYIDKLGGYIEPGITIYKTFKIINDKKFVSLSSNIDYIRFKENLKKKHEEYREMIWQR